MLIMSTLHCENINLFRQALRNKIQIFLCTPLEIYLEPLSCTFELLHNIESDDYKVSLFVDLMANNENTDLPSN